MGRGAEGSASEFQTGLHNGNEQDERSRSPSPQLSECEVVDATCDMRGMEITSLRKLINKVRECICAEYRRIVRGYWN